MPTAESTAASMDGSAASTSLLTDMYELTMLQGALASGAAARRSVFELFGRRLPGSRRFGVVAGTGRLLDAIEAFTFTPSQIDFLHRAEVVNDETLDFLRGYRFTGTIRGYAEGECYFAGSPLLTVEGTFAEACILETLALSIYNYDCAVASAASRMTIAAHGRPCVDFGARRGHEQAAVAAARASVVGGFVGTSNLEAGLLYGIPTVGTSAHSFTLLHDTEEDAFAAQVASLGPSTTILVDTYDITTGVERAVKAARAAGGELGAVRLDSGDLVAEAFKVRRPARRPGGDVDKDYRHQRPRRARHRGTGGGPVDSYGVGTKLVTGSGRRPQRSSTSWWSARAPTAPWEEVAKFSSGGKSTVGAASGPAASSPSEGTAAEELVVCLQLAGGRELSALRPGRRPTASGAPGR